jgi:hypothetical protein
MPQYTVNGADTVEGDVATLTTMLAGAPWAGAKLHLYQSSFAPNKGNVAADFTAAEANFTGYAPVALTYSAIGLDSNSDVASLSNRAFFQASDGVSPNTIGGCWVQLDVVGPPASHTSVEFYSFPTPLDVNSALQFIGVVVSVAQPGSPGYAIVDN